MIFIERDAPLCEHDINEEDKSIMRFRTYNPVRISGQFQKFAAEVIPYSARDDF